MTTTTPAVNGRVIALAHYAGRAVLETVLARYGMTFQQSVTLRPVAIADAPIERDGLVEQVTDALKVEAAEVRDVIEELTAKGLVASDGPNVLVTDAGRDMYAESSAETGKISARIYAGLSLEDLATTGRVLALVTERANAELATLPK
ncbi:MarR family transcriptional regulator [Streptomyces sp. NPDC050619]|uniref:MarR family transcriptional regulator n=1 Tax=Streptomyces sp. NPDC050619 TaxID=3157214 RepID=UPI00343B0E72